MTSLGASPLTKLLVFATVGVLLANRVLVSSRKAREPSALLSVIAPGLSHAFLYRSTGEYLLVALILYQLRVMEVACGPAKYGGLVLMSGMIGYGLQALVQYLFLVPSASGLHPVIFASLVGYYLDVPGQNTFSLFGAFELSDKSFLYGMAGRLALLHGWKSFVAGLSGVISGFLYFVFLPGLQRVVVPKWVFNVISE